MILELLAIKEINKPVEPPEPPPKPTIQIQPKQKKPKKIYYTVKKGDTITKVSKRFRVPVGRVLCANRHIDNPDLILPSERLKIPQKKDKLKCPKIKSQGKQGTLQSETNNHSIAPSGWYPYGECTWWVSTQRPVGRWHDATGWLSSAQAEGYSTGSTPRAGAIGWTYGHVVYVESVSGDMVTISEANYDFNGSIRTITVPASKYTYIY